MVRGASVGAVVLETVGAGMPRRQAILVVPAQPPRFIEGLLPKRIVQPYVTRLQITPVFAIHFGNPLKL